MISGPLARSTTSSVGVVECEGGLEDVDVVICDGMVEAGSTEWPMVALDVVACLLMAGRESGIEATGLPDK